MMEDRIGEALRDLIPEPPFEFTMDRLTAARSVRRRHAALLTLLVLAVLAAAAPIGVLSFRVGSGPTSSELTPEATARPPLLLEPATGPDWGAGPVLAI